MFLERK